MRQVSYAHRRNIATVREKAESTMSTWESTLVIGHRNPDTDAIASAVGYAWLLNSRVADRYIAGRAGEITAQTAFALDRFGLEAPPHVADVWVRVGDLAERLPSLKRGQKLLEACQSVARTRRPAPVLEDGDKPVGLLSGTELFAALAEGLGSASVLALARDLDRPAESAITS